MKKLIFLLVTVVFLTGMVYAKENAKPPGGFAFAAVMSEYGMDSHAVTPDTVLADVSQEAPCMSFLAPEVRLKSCEKADNAMRTIETTVINVTTVDMESLRPQITAFSRQYLSWDYNLRRQADYFKRE
jgi:hypothetical protein